MQQVTDCYGKTYPLSWKEVTETIFDNALGVLPPLAWHGKGFLLGEAWTGKTCSIAGENKQAYHAFAHVRPGQWLECSAPLTVAEFKAMTVQEILQAVAQ